MTEAMYNIPEPVAVDMCSVGQVRTAHMHNELMAGFAHVIT